MILKDNLGRDVFFMDEGWEADQTRIPSCLMAVDGSDLVVVDEAIIFEGEEVLPSQELVAKHFENYGFPNLKFTISKGNYHMISVDGLTSEWSGVFTRIYFINGKVVDEEKYKQIQRANAYIGRISGFDTRCICLNNGAFRMTIREALRLIGLGKTVTVESLGRGCAKGEDRPRLLPGDNCKIVRKGNEIKGVIRSIKGVKVALQDTEGVKYTTEIDKVEYIDDVDQQLDGIKILDDSLRDNFDFVLEESKKRMMRLPVERSNFVFPMFPKDGPYGMETQTKVEDAPTCTCPICGWVMSYDPHNQNEFVCCYCLQRGQVVSITDKDVVLVMMRSPAKNRFAVKEARCCGNCGRFEFEVGRQGKRSTGYCQAANQCLQAHNVCNLWYPRDIGRFEQNMKQNTTNLHYGVTDERNTSRNDIRDTVYTEEDHQKAVVIADKIKKAYAVGYQYFLRRMRNSAKEVPLIPDMTDDVREYWKGVLDDPC